MNCVIRLWLSFSSISFFGVIYAMNNLDKIIEYMSIPKESKSWLYLIVLIPFVMSFFSLLLCKLFAKIATENNAIFIEPANNDFITNYLAFFFVALSINKFDVFLIVLSLTFIFTFFSRVSYFNPAFLVFRYNFYYVTTINNVKIMVITKKKLKTGVDYKALKNIKTINDYTFIKI